MGTPSNTDDDSGIGKSTLKFLADAAADVSAGSFFFFFFFFFFTPSASKANKELNHGVVCMYSSVSVHWLDRAVRAHAFFSPID